MERKAHIKLIKGWSSHEGGSRIDYSLLEINKGDLSDSKDEQLINVLYEKTQAGGRPACGNKHAGRGSMRIISNHDSICFENNMKLSQALEERIEKLGNRVLVSAGHYMPYKAKPNLVNPNSYQSLLNGLELLKRLYRNGRNADLLVTINDVTVNKSEEDNQSLPTLTNDERNEYYDTNFQLPSCYRKSILSLIEELDNKFDVFVIGENKLSEKLKREIKAKKYADFFLHPKGDKNYYLDKKIDLGRIIEIAHHGKEGVSTLYNEDNPIFIANSGAIGRPKCVRACTRLAALPYEEGYTGYIQFLPVCSRNALEGFLIGQEMFSKIYQKTIPFLSVHNVYSCF